MAPVVLLRILTGAASRGPARPLLLLLWGLLAAAPSVADPNSEAPDIGLFLDDQGHLDLERARRWGYEGPVRLGEHWLSRDPGSHDPIFGQEPRPAAAGDEHWSSAFYYPGLDGPIQALTVHNGLLVAGGAFNLVGGQNARHVAAWDGQNWRPLGETNDWVVCFAEYNGDLIAGGLFSLASDNLAYGVARWDGAAWQPMGTGFDGSVWALTVHDGMLVAGGGFTAAGTEAVSNVARWDGEAWRPMGDGFDGPLLDLEVFEGQLIAGGYFDSTGAEPVNYVARWDGAAWRPLGDGFDDAVLDLISFDGSLIACGDFRNTSGAPMRHLARWDGASWVDVGNGTGGPLAAMLVHNGKLVTGGLFHAAGETKTENIAAWDGSSWTSIHSGFNGVVYALTEYEGRLVAGGIFTHSGATPTEFIATLDETGWTPLANETGAGFNHALTVLYMHQGDLIAGGDFTVAGTKPIWSIARWDGSNWSPMGDGLTGSPYTLTTFRGELYAGGNFRYSGNTETRGIARWDGTAWNPVGSGVNGIVASMTEHQGNLVVGGEFTRAGASRAFSCAEWDGLFWRSFGSDFLLSSGRQGRVMSLVHLGNTLYAVGMFAKAGGQPASNVARWESEWIPMPGVFNGPLYVSTVYQGKLIVGGGFTTINEQTIRFVARWDGSSWSALGDGPDRRVMVFAEHHGELYAGGLFTVTGGVYTGPLVRWNGSTWSGLGSGISGGDGWVLGLASSPQGLYVGGNFTHAGRTPSSRVGLWREPDITPVTLAYFRAERRGSEARLTWETTGEPTEHAGFHVYREEPGTERRRINDSLLSGRRTYSFDDPAPLAQGGAYWLAEVSRDGTLSWHGPASVGPALENTPVLSLAQNDPNPMRASTEIVFELPRDGRVLLRVFSPTGREVTRLVDGALPAGEHRVTWNGLGLTGRPAAAGVYLYRLETPWGLRAQKLVRL